MSTLIEDALDLAQAGTELREMERERVEAVRRVNEFFDGLFAEARRMERENEL